MAFASRARGTAASAAETIARSTRVAHWHGDVALDEDAVGSNGQRKQECSRRRKERSTNSALRVRATNLPPKERDTLVAVFATTDGRRSVALLGSLTSG